MLTDKLTQETKETVNKYKVEGLMMEDVSTILDSSQLFFLVVEAGQ